MWSIVGGILGGLFKAVFGWLTERQARADEIELGQQRQRAEDTTKAMEAERRMAAAAAEPHDADTTQGRLKDGSF